MRTQKTDAFRIITGQDTLVKIVPCSEKKNIGLLELPDWAEWLTSITKVRKVLGKLPIIEY